MKVTKRLSDYIAIKVESKIPIMNNCAIERDINSLMEALNKEFVEKVNILKDEFLKEAEEKYPQLKHLTRNSFDKFHLYHVYGSDFENNIRKLEREEHYKRRTVHERVLLRLELSSKELSLDDIDLIIEAEIAKVTLPSTES